MILRQRGAYFVKSNQTGLNVGGPYATRAEAQKMERRFEFRDMTRRRAYAGLRPTNYLAYLRNKLK
ncbi:hypothetical protein HYU92_06180 [Candidatus Curtissbacteria bacterium]|nr:hypothetical protein [Candidatus Curtissbacteria bacterium]